MAFVLAAGLPWFVALFDRDSLIISLQNAIVHPEFALGALDVLARWQVTERDDYRDAERGKIHHELRRGELAHFKLIPHTPYYGTADATPLYLHHPAFGLDEHRRSFPADQAPRHGRTLPRLDRRVRRSRRRRLPGIRDPVARRLCEPGLEGLGQMPS